MQSAAELQYHLINEDLPEEDEFLFSLVIEEARRPVEAHKKTYLWGSLSDCCLPDLMVYLRKKRKTGVLSIAQNGTKRRVFVREGLPVKIRSNVQAELLGEFLLSKKIISREQQQRALNLQKKRKIIFGAALIMDGAISGTDLFAQTRSQFSSILCALFSETEGNFRFQECFLPRESDGHRVSFFRMMTVGIRMISDRQILDEMVGGLNQIPTATALFPEREKILFTPQERMVTRQIGEMRSIETIIKVSGLDPQVVLKTLLILRYHGMVKFGSAPSDTEGGHLPYQDVSEVKLPATDGGPLAAEDEEQEETETDRREEPVENLLEEKSTWIDTLLGGVKPASPEAEETDGSRSKKEQQTGSAPHGNESPKQSGAIEAPPGSLIREGWASSKSREERSAPSGGWRDGSPRGHSKIPPAGKDLKDGRLAYAAAIGLAMLLGGLFYFQWHLVFQDRILPYSDKSELESTQAEPPAGRPVVPDQTDAVVPPGNSFHAETEEIPVPAIATAEPRIRAEADMLPENLSSVAQPARTMSFVLLINGRKEQVSDGAVFDMAHSDELVIEDVTGVGGDPSTVKINFVGFRRNREVNDGNDRGYPIRPQALLKRFALDATGNLYGIRAMQGTEAVGEVFVRIVADDGGGLLPTTDPTAMVGDFVLLVNDKLRRIPNGEMTEISDRDSLMILGVTRQQQGDAPFKTNFIGFVGGQNANAGDDRGYVIHPGDLIKRFSVDMKGDLYRMEAKHKGRLMGECFVRIQRHLSDPAE